MFLGAVTKSPNFGPSFDVGVPFLDVVTPSPNVDAPSPDISAPSFDASAPSSSIGVLFPSFLSVYLYLASS